ncbi:embryonic stem cell-specific 5-hydroxymethylcytosine-binding protein isoform X2 [Tupaia chinensis]|uniref:embryonic stem cell-specific 5-hydroxymethylcytosine-binding protein isoform X3 n=1 Tax=Tupaia chinensis TaxID=246437 RepID=UPI000703CC42|nr:embryonic stem cell-specific 5-hydroxymethylcytosine-binding protein isoform X3 [Tupaia chinensis]XP_014440223.1 embryonic stem cell-specific 5-hydroxymethylcytosine-binding protein isoform X2 [Tupaia chinensis]
MCGRTSCHLPPDALARACAYRDRRGQQRLPDWRAPGRYRPSYNQGPRSVGPVLLSRLHLDKNADSSERILTPMRWGLVPSWFKESDPCKLQFNTANCRSDTMMEKRSFKVPLGKGRRCVVLADGFYEWQRQQGATQRQPYFIYFPQIKTEQGSPPALTSGGSSAADSPGHPEKAWDSWRLLTMAGIFDCWAPPEGGDPLYSYTIITVDSCKGLEDIHHRMPAILDGDEAVSKWLDFGEVPIQEALTLIRPTENITFHPVSPVVNSVRNNTPECLAPVNLVVSKEFKASGSSQTMLQWLATKSPKKEDPKTLQKDELAVPHRSSELLQKSPLPKRGSAGLLERWLKRGQEEPTAKRLHTE